MSTYDVKSIQQLSEREHVRRNPGMYVGNTETPTRLLDEVLDNSIDEVQADYCDKIAIFIDTNKGSFSVVDTGRGMPFDQSLDVEQDPPVLACTQLRTSGKFQKEEDASAYQIATGLHGIGLTACNFLSEKMTIEIYRENKKATYTFMYDGTINRTEASYDTQTRPFSTKVTVYPSKKHYKNLSVDLKHIEERLRIVCANYPNLKTILVVDEKKTIITGTESDLILDYLGKGVENWIKVSTKKKPESCDITFGWDTEDSSSAPKVLGVVNLIRVQEGSHINEFYKIVKNIFEDCAKKHKFQFNADDCLRWLRVYINLKIRKTSFEAQIKVKLGNDSDLSIMNNIEQQVKLYFKDHEDILLDLLDRFQRYRDLQKGKKLVTNKSGKRLSHQFTKLCDCIEEQGELFIGEGESAMGGLKQVRNNKKHAILPLKGKISNALTKDDLLGNTEVKEILQALGTGFDTNFNISGLRYNKIIISADADPDGNHITALLIGLFMTKTPELIKQGYIYVCDTPLFGHGTGKNFIPLWSDEEVEKARKDNKTIHRYKGLGEFNPEELGKFLLDDSHRQLIQLEWPEDNNLDDIKLLFTRADEKRDLIMGVGKWTSF